MPKPIVNADKTVTIVKPPVYSGSKQTSNLVKTTKPTSNLPAITKQTQKNKKQQYTDTGTGTTMAEKLVKTVGSTTLDAQQRADQAMAQQANYQSPTVSQAKQELQQETAVPVVTKTTGAKKTTVSGGTAVTKTVPTTEAITQEPTTQKVLENPYQKQLENMQFDYNPQSDHDYLESASALENQVAQAMVGRGGLFSSVAQSAYQARLISLQNDFRTQKYNQFVQDRDFTLSLAKEWSDEQATKWQQAQTEKEFAFAQQKEQFDQQMAIASYNLQVQAQKFSQQQARAAAAQKRADAIAAQEAENAKTQIAQRTMLIQGNAIISKKEREKYNTLLSEWQQTGYASTEVSSYFNVPYGGNISKYAGRIQGKNSYLSSIESTIIGDAYTVGLDSDFLDMIYSSVSTNYINPATYSPTPYSETTTYDSQGVPTGKTKTTRYGE